MESRRHDASHLVGHVLGALLVLSAFVGIAAAHSGSLRGAMRDPLAVPTWLFLLTGGGVIGADRWFDAVDPPARAFRLCGRLAPVSVEDGRLRLRLPGSRSRRANGTPSKRPGRPKKSGSGGSGASRWRRSWRCTSASCSRTPWRRRTPSRRQSA